MEQKQLFRKAAIEKLSSPEQLDVLMKVTSPKGWVAMYTLAAIIVGVVTWGILGEVAERVPGEGLLVGGTYYTIESDVTGIIEEMNISQGDQVTAGMTIATIDQPNVNTQQEVANARNRFENAETLYENARIAHQANAAGWDTTINNLSRNIQDAESQIAQLRTRLDDPNYARNVIQRQIDDLEVRLTQYQSQIETARQAKRSSEQQLQQYRAQMEDARNQYETVQERTGRYSNIAAPVGGQAIEVTKRQGDSVTQGEMIARLVADSEQGMQATFYVDAYQATRIAPGDPVEVSPAGIPKEEYGFLKGEVTSRSGASLTQQQLLRDLGGDQNLVGSILEMSRTVYRVEARLLPADTPTGYEWSSGEGFPTPLEANSPVQVNVVVDTRAPYTFVIPAIRAAVGGGGG